MDERVKEAIHKKIEESVLEKDEAIALSHAIGPSIGNCKTDLTTGIIIGRIYNSFHYQTRRMLGRNATAQEFDEFVDLIRSGSGKIKSSLE